MIPTPTAIAPSIAKGNKRGKIISIGNPIPIIAAAKRNINKNQVSTSLPVTVVVILVISKDNVLVPIIGSAILEVPPQPAH